MTKYFDPDLSEEILETYQLAGLPEFLRPFPFPVPVGVTIGLLLPDLLVRRG